ncbi:spore coat U domain-containing protein [Pseudochrobactrum sp. MP213Fo]|uniref:Csu type fimbrial protein n=1 Tax=Pseudochrobactrum sp. MP213Fo TaxID=3022250 RepID=UPI003B9E0512
MYAKKTILSVTCLMMSAGLMSASHATDATGSLAVKVTIGAACQLTSGDGSVLDFGRADDLSKDLNAQTAAGSGIKVKCSSGTAYTLGLDNGTNPTGGSAPFQRQMVSGDAKVPYGLYQDADRKVPWPDIDDKTALKNTGNGTEQEMAVYGTVPKMDKTPASGDYADTVKVTLRF